MCFRKLPGSAKLEKSENLKQNRKRKNIFVQPNFWQSGIHARSPLEDQNCRFQVIENILKGEAHMTLRRLWIKRMAKIVGAKS